VLRVVLVLLIVGLYLMAPAIALASALEVVIVVANPWTGGNECVSNFDIVVKMPTGLDIYQAQLSWTPAATGNGTRIVSSVGGWPDDCTDGIIYEGNGSSVTHVITDENDLIEGVYYRAYTVTGGGCSICYASGSVIASGNEAPSQGSTGNVTINTQGLDDMAGLMRVGFILAFPAIIGIIGAFRHSLGAYLVGIVGMGVSLAYVNDELGIYLTMPVLILITALLFGAILDAWHERIVII
jgi:hypothetical protein